MTLSSGLNDSTQADLVSSDVSRLGVTCVHPHSSTCTYKPLSIRKFPKTTLRSALLLNLGQVVLCLFCWVTFCLVVFSPHPNVTCCVYRLHGYGGKAVSLFGILIFCTAPHILELCKLVFLQVIKMTQSSEYREAIFSSCIIPKHVLFHAEWKSLFRYLKP